MRALIPLLLLAPPAAAQTTFALPQGCEGLVTIQKRSCSVTNLFTCAADPEGYQRRVDFDEQGMTYAGTIDAETQWIESWQPLAGVTETLAEGPVDPASLTGLLATGTDTFDFQTLSQPGGYVTIFRGQDRLIGETVVIDGVTLDRTEFAVSAYDEAGNELWRTWGNEYVQRDWRTFIAGTRTNRTPDEEWTSDNSPVEFIFPGEAGFLSSTPRHDCGAMLSMAPGLTDGGVLSPAAYPRN